MRLSALESRIGAVIGGALLPADDPHLFGGVRRGADLGALIGHQVSAAAPLTALGLRLSLWMIWLAPLWHEGRLTTLGRLHSGEREALLEVLLKHDAYLVRQAMTLLKVFYCMAFLGDTAVLAQLSAYDLRPPPLRPLSGGRPGGGAPLILAHKAGQP